MNSKRIRILPYKIGSSSAHHLAQRLGCLQIKPDETSKFVGTNKDIIVNWGNSKFTPMMKRGQQSRILNKPDRINVSVNKLTAFQVMQNNGVSVPKFCNTAKSATALMENGAKRIFCRTTLTGSGGDGIHIARKPSELIHCALYVEGIPKAEEYRVHVLRNRVVDVQEKRAKTGASKDEGWNAEIRNAQFGWIFAREGVNAPESVKKEAIKAVAALGLDFGAVDLAIDKRDGKPKVFEVNTSPGLEATTLDNYANAFQSLLNEMQVRDDY